MLVLVGWLQVRGGWFYSTSCAGTAALLFWNVYALDMKNPVECMWLFVYGARIIRSSMSFDLALEAYLV